jgi:Domain of unknown function (DUF222)
MGDAQQAGRAGFAHQLLAIGEFGQRRLDQSSGEHDSWCVDDWEAIAAEIGISRARAASQMHYGQALLERFPKLGAVFLAGRVDFRVIAAIRGDPGAALLDPRDSRVLPEKDA